MPKKERRSIRNLRVTSRHHLLYLGGLIYLAFVLVIALYVTVLYHLYFLSQTRPDLQLGPPAVMATLVAALLMVLVAAVGMLTAHRIRGVHVKLCKVLRRVERGKLDTRIRFRSYDRLDDVEHAFNDMMDALEKRISEAEKSTLT